MFTPVAQDCPIEVFRWGGQPDHHPAEKTHSHPFDELMLIRQGGGEHLIGGQSMPLLSNSVHIIPAGTAHHLQRTRQCDGGTVIFLKNYVLSEPYLPFKELDFYQINTPALQIEPDAFSDIWLIYEHLLYESRNPQQYYYRKPLLLSWLNALFVKISEHFRSVNTRNQLQEALHPAVTGFLHLLESNYSTQRSVSFYARQLHVSPQYLHELCLKQLGKGPQETIGVKVASEALAILSLGMHSIKEVAWKLGFEDPAYFSRFMKKQTGKTPTDWAKH